MDKERTSTKNFALSQWGGLSTGKFYNNFLKSIV
jgi:hypothetical protein